MTDVHLLQERVNQLLQSYPRYERHGYGSALVMERFVRQFHDALDGHTWHIRHLPSGSIDDDINYSSDAIHFPKNGSDASLNAGVFAYLGNISSVQVPPLLSHSMSSRRAESELNYRVLLTWDKEAVPLTTVKSIRYVSPQRASIVGVHSPKPRQAARGDIIVKPSPKPVYVELAGDTLYQLPPGFSSM